VRFVLNGAFAACVHFAALVFLLSVAGLPSAGLANGIAAIAGVGASFFGNRHFVFRAQSESVWHQLGKFGLLYSLLALMHGGLLLLWTDLAGLDYRIGFLLGAAVQALCTYIGGRHWVFRA